MKTYALGMIAASVLVACGGGGGSGDDDGTISIDASGVSIDAPVSVPDATPNLGSCNPVAAPGDQGCSTGEKCTWIQIEDTPDAIGALGCVPDGTVPLGAACTQGAVGEATGYDNCVAGAICIGASTAGVCKDICGFDGGVTSSCTEGNACTRYAGLGANGDDDPVIGACNPTCDPLTQTHIVDGNVESCGVGLGCYLLASTVDTIAVCAGAGTGTQNQPITGTTYANSCSPGYVPRVAVQGQAGNECTALCKPAAVYDGMNDGRMGRPDYEGGDSTATNFSGHEATCLGASMTAGNPGGDTSLLPGVAVTGEACQFYWTREPSVNVTNFSNTLGWCFNVQSWKYDPDGMEPIDNTADYPRCSSDGVTIGATAMTTGDLIPPIGDPPHDDALYFGCTPLPSALTGAAPVRRPEPVQLDRLGSYRN
jgi:hypothetical protein